MVKYKSISVRPGQSFELKLNFTNESIPEEFSFVKLADVGGQFDIRDLYLQYTSNGGMINGTVFDERLSFTGNVSRGQVWFRFVRVTAQDSSLYGVLYMQPNSVKVHAATLDVEVIKNGRFYHHSTGYL